MFDKGFKILLMVFAGFVLGILQGGGHAPLYISIGGMAVLGWLSASLGRSNNMYSNDEAI